MKPALRVLALAALALTLGLAGCQKSAPPPYPTYTESTSIPAEMTSIREYERAGQTLADAIPDELNKVEFSAGRRSELLPKALPALQILREGQQYPSDFHFVPTSPLGKQGSRQSLRLLGHALEWQISSLSSEGRTREATTWFLVATRFGLDLTGGNSLDASLGYVILDTSRRAYLPSFEKLESRELQNLGAALQDRLSKAPGIEAVLEHDRMDMLAGIDDLQDRYRSNTVKELGEKLGNDILPAIKHLVEIPKDSPDRVAFFDGMAKEARLLTSHAIKLSTLTPKQREDADPPELGEDRPWRRWSRHLFGGAESTLLMHDRTLARTRLLALHALVRAEVQTKKTLPQSIAELGSSLSIDPFTGKTFIYHVQKDTYRLYSAGFDMRDDGGETDEAFDSPDLRLELLVL